MGVKDSPQMRERRKPSKDINSRVEFELPATTGLSEDKHSFSSLKMNVSAEAYKANEYYQQFDDWASETEKTDYTYSRLSKYKDKEVLPGFRIRPNLSRSPIRPSSPGSRYDYTAESVQEKRQFYTPVGNSYSYRGTAFEESSEVDAFVEETSWRQWIVEILISIYTSIVSSVSTASRSILYTLITVASWLYTTCKRPFVAVKSSLLRSSQQSGNVQGASSGGFYGYSWWKSAENVAANDHSEQYEQNGVRGWLVHTVTTFWTYIVTTTTVVTHSAANQTERIRRHKYWWLLFLLPLLLLGLLWLLWDDRTDISSLPEAFLGFMQSSTALALSIATEVLLSVYTFLIAIPTGILSNIAPLFDGVATIPESAIGIIQSSTTSALFTTTDALLSIYTFLISIVAGALSSVASLFDGAATIPEAFIGIIYSSTTSVVSATTEALLSIYTFLISIPVGILSSIASLFDGVAKLPETFTGINQSATGSVLSATTDAFLSVYTFLIAIPSGIASSIASLFDGVATIAETFIGFIYSSTASALSATTDALWPIYTSLIGIPAGILSITTSLFDGVAGIAYQAYTLIADSVNSLFSFLVGFFTVDIFSGLRTCTCFISSSFGWWWSLLTALFTNFSVFLWGLLPNSTSSAISEPLLDSLTRSVVKPELKSDGVYGQKQKEQVLSDELRGKILQLQERIEELEVQLRGDLKNLKTVEDGYVETLKNYQMSLLDHRAATDAASRRCCRWPCTAPPSQNFLTAISTKISSNVVQDTLVELRQQSKDDIEKLKAEVAALLAAQKNVATSVDLRDIQQMVATAIRLYDADKTGRPDYALESGGGRVVSIRCTKSYSVKGYDLLGYKIFWDSRNLPELAIRPSMSPGECWSFEGAVGSLVLELSYPIFVTGFTMEHISASVSPTGKIDSAPKDFQVWGLNSADDIYDMHLFGSYAYEDNGHVIQYFPVTNPLDQLYKFVELKIISNHGHPDYTCLYRIRVHGTVT